jgi:hypothetical protein
MAILIVVYPYIYRDIPAIIYSYLSIGIYWYKGWQ